MTIANVTPWVQPAPFKIDADDLGLSEDQLQDLSHHCMEMENMYDYMDGDFTAVFHLSGTLFLEDPTEGDPDEEIIDYIAVIKKHLPEDYKENSIGVFFCNG